jgi:hypothetical protein
MNTLTSHLTPRRGILNAAAAMCLAFGCLSAATAQTNVTGSVGTTIWTVAGSPYFITGQCTVATGNVLTIEPGVEVLAHADVAMIIEGSLHAVGATGDTILFGLDTSQTQWGGLRFFGGDTSTVHFAEITGVYTTTTPRKLSRRPKPERKDRRSGDRSARVAKPAYTTFYGVGGGVEVTGTGTRLGLAYSRIHDNTARKGGGISINDGAHVSAVDCKVMFNDGTTDGGGVYIYDGATATLTNCDIIGNMSTYGGGVYIEMAASATITNCDISGNLGEEEGGGVYMEASSADFTDCTIDNNLVYYYDGGAVFIEDGSTTFKNCTMNGNMVEDYYGGGCSIYYSTADFDNCTISGNSAGESGGGLISEYSKLTITGSEISNNTSLGYNGGGINTNNVTLSLTDCKVSSNAADRRGGGLYVYDSGVDSTATFVRCRIENNTGAYEGGGMWTNAPTTMDRCILATNVCNSATTDGHGGGLAVMGGSLVMDNCTIAGNEAQVFVFVPTKPASFPGLGGGVWLDSTGTSVDIANTIVWGNTPDDLADDPIASYTLDVSYSDIGTTLPETIPGPGNINQDPILKMAGPADSLYHLIFGSPCINAGNPASPPDLDRTIADMGAFPFDMSSLFEFAIPTQGVSRKGESLIEVKGTFTDMLSAELVFTVDTSIVDAAAGFLRSHVFEGLPGFSASANLVGDTVKIVFSSSSPVSIEGATVAELAFDLNVAALFDTTTFIWVVDSTNVNEWAATLLSGEIQVHPLYGDASDDGTVTGYDASMILRNVVGYDEPLVEVTVDVTGTSGITAFDAAHVLWKILDPGYMFPVEGGTMKRAGPGTPKISWTSTENGWALIADDATGINAGRVVLTLPDGTSAVVSGFGEVVYRQAGNKLYAAFARWEPGTVELLKFDISGAAPTVDELELNEGIFVQPASLRPLELALAQNAPNPFNPVTTIGFTVPSNAHVNLSIYNIQGQRVHILADREMRAGVHSVTWGGRDAVGRPVASGVYLYRITHGGNSQVRKMVMVR